MTLETTAIGGKLEASLYVDCEKRRWKSFLVTPDKMFYVSFKANTADFDKLYVKNSAGVAYKVNELWKKDEQHWFTIGDKQWLVTIKHVTPDLKELKDMKLRGEEHELTDWYIEGEVNDISIVPAEIACLKRDIPVGNMI